VDIEVAGGDVAVKAMSAGSPQPGRYEATGLPEGSFTVTFSQDGYQTQVVELDVLAGQQVLLDVALVGEEGAISGVASGCVSAELRLGNLTPLVPPRSDTLAPCPPSGSRRAAQNRG
jgi:hypothetical protein